MAIIKCDDCGHFFSDKRNLICPKCHPKIVPPPNPYALPMKQQLILGPAIGLAFVLIFAACQQIPTADKGTIACMMEARAQAKAAGNPNFKYAKEVFADKAMLVFSKGGRTWETNYFCD